MLEYLLDEHLPNYGLPRRRCRSCFLKIDIVKGSISDWWVYSITPTSQNSGIMAARDEIMYGLEWVLLEEMVECKVKAEYRCVDDGGVSVNLGEKISVRDIDLYLL